jgi:hypothetical protein
MGDQTASLIMILHALQIYGEGTPSTASLLYRFSVFSQWYRSPGDEGKTFEQKVSLARDGENPILENITAFQLVTQVHRIVSNFHKLPTFVAGEYNLTLSVRVQGESQWSEPIASYPLTIIEIPKPQPQQPLVQ